MRQFKPLYTTLAVSACALCWQCSTASAAGHDPLEGKPGQALNAAFLLQPGSDGTGLAAVWEVFEATARHAGVEVRVFSVAASTEPAVTDEGLRLLPDYTFEDHPPVDILVVPGVSRGSGPEPEAFDWVGRTGADADYVLSLCRGAFLVARAGLLDDHAATTCPGGYEELGQGYPGLDLHINAWFVHDGGVITSQGGSRSSTAALYLVELLFGREVTQAVADELLLTWPLQDQPRPTFVTDGRRSQ